MIQIIYHLQNNGNFVTIKLKQMADMTQRKPEKIKDVLSAIKDCLKKGHYFVTSHAFIRQKERMISLPESLHILETGYEEKKKSYFDIEHNTWKYAIRGKTIRDELDIRVIVAFDEKGMLIITVMHVEKL
jgi:hypothetical protein